MEKEVISWNDMIVMGSWRRDEAGCLHNFNARGVDSTWQ